jgi:hypothetical protein
MSGDPRVRVIAAMLFAVSLPLALVARQSNARLMTITAQRMLDVDNGVVIPDAVVVIENDHIVAAGPRSSTPPRGTVTELGDVTLLPGLIDAHVHLTLSGGAEANARATLLAGFTTVQDLGALGYANIRLRNSINNGKVPGPHVVSAGPWLGESGLTCDFQGIGVKGPDAFRERVRKDVESGAELIKVCAGHRPQQGRSDTRGDRVRRKGGRNGLGRRRTSERGARRRHRGPWSSTGRPSCASERNVRDERGSRGDHDVPESKP